MMGVRDAVGYINNIGKRLSFPILNEDVPLYNLLNHIDKLDNYVFIDYVFKKRTGEFYFLTDRGFLLEDFYVDKNKLLLEYGIDISSIENSIEDIENIDDLFSDFSDNNLYNIENDLSELNLGSDFYFDNIDLEDNEEMYEDTDDIDWDTDDDIDWEDGTDDIDLEYDTDDIDWEDTDDIDLEDNEEMYEDVDDIDWEYDDDDIDTEDEDIGTDDDDIDWEDTDDIDLEDNEEMYEDIGDIDTDDDIDWGADTEDIDTDDIDWEYDTEEWDLKINKNHKKNYDNSVEFNDRRLNDLDSKVYPLVDDPNDKFAKKVLKTHDLLVKTFGSVKDSLKGIIVKDE